VSILSVLLVLVAGFVCVAVVAGVVVLVVMLTRKK
jgi:hypothetical protein